MKKILFFTVLAVFGLTSLSAQGISIGAKAGVNFASLNGDDINIDGRTSFHVGGVVNVSVSELFAVQPEVVYSAQGGTQSMGGVDSTTRFDYINIPIMADFTVAPGLSLQGGPQIGINTTSEFEIDGGGTTEIEDSESVDFGAGIGGQFKMPALGLFFQARYVIGFNEVVKDVDAKNSVVTVSVGWFFN